MMIEKHHDNTIKLAHEAESHESHPPSLPLPPRMEYINGFLIDTRASKRELVEEYKPANSDKIIRIEIADKEDRAIIGQFFVDLFNKSCSMFSCLDPSYEDTGPFFFDLLDHVLDKRCCIVAFDENKLVGFVLSTVHAHDDLPKIYPRGLCEDAPVFEIKDDYGYDIDNGPYPSRKGNQAALFCGECYEQTGKFLPKDIKNFAVCDAVGVHPDYFRNKIFNRMMEISDDILRSKGCNYSFGYFAAVASYEYSKKRGYKIVAVFPYDRFKDHGKVPFQNLCDNAFGIHLGLLKL